MTTSLTHKAIIVPDNHEDYVATVTPTTFTSSDVEEERWVVCDEPGYLQDQARTLGQLRHYEIVEVDWSLDPDSDTADAMDLQHLYFAR